MFEGVTDIFFDLDHTLWDFERNSALTFEKIFSEQRIPVILHDFLEVYIPLNKAYWKLYRENQITQPELRYQRLKKAFDRIGVHVTDEIIEILSQEYVTHLSSFTHLFPNTEEVLDYLEPRYRLHIITNGFQEIQEKKLRKSNIHKYFDYIIDSELAGVKKPDPYIFRLALDKAKIASNKALMIGDNLEADILGAQAVGMQALHFNADKQPNHDICAMINNLIEIKGLL